MKFTESDIQLPVLLGGVKFRNPFYVASGPTTMTVDQIVRIEETGWGGASMKLTFDPPPYINRHPRYGYWKKDGILSFTTEKRMAFMDMLGILTECRKKTSRVILFSNFTYAGDKGLEGWVNMAKGFEDAGAHINEINMCCPNMSYNVELSKEGSQCGPKTGASLGQQLDAVKEIVAAIKSATKIPLFVKLTPEGGRIAQVAKACYEAGADAVGGTANRLTIHHIDLDHPTKSPIQLQEEISMQCMCSSWVHPLGLRDVYEIRKLNGPDVKITGAGGVTDWKSAAEMFLCGANLVGICAETLISGFGFMPKLVAELKQWMKKHKIQDPQSLTNTIPPAIKSAPEVTLYAGNAHLKNADLSAPCVYQCPASVPAQAYISKIAEGEFKEGYEILTSATPLMSVCAIVCDHPCENACTRKQKDEALRIRDLKRFLMEQGKKHKWEPKPALANANGKSVAVIGSGPSGLTAAQLLARAGYKVKVFESASQAGGMLRWGLPSFRCPSEVVDEEVSRVRALGVEFEMSRTLGKDLHLENLKREYDAVYIAIGAQKGVALKIKGEKAKGVFSAVDFLRAVHQDKAPKIGKRVAVIGGGFTAVDSARSAIRLGAKEAYILYRRTKDEMPASREEIAEAEEEGVRILFLVSPKEIKVKSGKVSSIIMQNQVLGGSDDSGRRKPEPVGGTEFELKVDTVISALGQAVDLGNEKGIPKSKWATLLADAKGFTGLKGVYAGGDAVLGASTVIEAIATAKNAAAAIDKALMKSEAVLKPLPEKEKADVENVLTRNGEDPRKWRIPLILVPAEKRKKNFEPYTPVLGEREAMLEAARCYRCGCGEGCMICHDICKMFAYHKEGVKVALDKDKCVACGMCIWRCPNQNIKMEQTSRDPI